MSLDDILPTAGQAIRLATRLSPAISTRRYSQPIVCQLLSLCEALLLTVLTAGVFFPSTQTPQATVVFSLTGAAATGTIIFLIALCTGSASYDRFASRIALLAGAIVAACCGALGAILGGADWSYVLLSAAILFSGVFVAKVPTVMVRGLLDRRGLFIRLVAILSNDAANIQACTRTFCQRPDIRIVFRGEPSALSDLDALVRLDMLDEIVLADSTASFQEIAELAGLSVTLVQSLPVRFPHRSRTDITWGKTNFDGPWNGPALVLSQPPLQGWGAVIKRCVDLGGAAMALAVLGLPMIAIAIAIRLESPGPALFVQERVGYRNARFRMYKFRSMRNDCADATGAQLTQRIDPRVTKVGHFIRRTSLDELPQLLNVLIGNMSLVGPRPHPLAAKAGTKLYDQLIPNFYSRYRMKPGVTGLAQVSGLRGNTETEQCLIDRFAKDVEYADNWAPMLDVAILFRTVGHLIKTRNAF